MIKAENTDTNAAKKNSSKFKPEKTQGLRNQKLGTHNRKKGMETQERRGKTEQTNGQREREEDEDSNTQGVIK